MKSNPRLKSRIKYKFTFPEYSVTELATILQRQLQPKIRIKQNGWLAKNIVAEVIINFTSHLSFKDEGVKLVILDNNVIAAC